MAASSELRRSRLNGCSIREKEGKCSNARTSMRRGRYTSTRVFYMRACGRRSSEVGPSNRPLLIACLACVAVGVGVPVAAAAKSDRAALAPAAAPAEAVKGESRKGGSAGRRGRSAGQGNVREGQRRDPAPQGSGGGKPQMRKAAGGGRARGGSSGKTSSTTVRRPATATTTTTRRLRLRQRLPARPLPRSELERPGPRLSAARRPRPGAGRPAPQRSGVRGGTFGTLGVPPSARPRSALARPRPAPARMRRAPARIPPAARRAQSARPRRP